MGQQFYPFFDADIQTKIKAEFGEDKVLVFNDNKDFYLAEKIGDRYVVDISKDQSQLAQVVLDMGEGTWQRKSS